MLVLGEGNLLAKIAKIIKFDLEFSDQIEVELKKNIAQLEQKMLSVLFNQGTSLCLYLEEKNNSENEILSKDKKQKSEQKTHEVQVILKDASSGAELLKKTFSCQDQSFVYHSHKISDELVLLLTGEKGPMLSTLAYCEQLSSKHKIVCISDHTCMFKRIVVTAPTINVAPCWHSKAPALFYSQFTRVNGRLMALDLRNKKHKIVCSYDGLNMQPSFSLDGERAAICMSGEGRAQIYLYDQRLCNQLNRRLINQKKQQKRRFFKPLTRNRGNNVSPCLLPDDNLIFCSDFQTGLPQIYFLDTKTIKTRRLTNGRGYCASPSYCAKLNSIVYTRREKGLFQLFSLNFGEKRALEQQLTFSGGDKLDPTWSECGRYVAFAYNYISSKAKKRTQQIAVLSINSGKIRILTSGKHHKSFPAWTNRALYQL